MSIKHDIWSDFSNRTGQILTKLGGMMHLRTVMKHLKFIQIGLMKTLWLKGQHWWKRSNAKTDTIHLILMKLGGIFTFLTLCHLKITVTCMMMTVIIKGHNFKLWKTVTPTLPIQICWHLIRLVADWSKRCFIIYGGQHLPLPRAALWQGVLTKCLPNVNVKAGWSEAHELSWQKVMSTPKLQLKFYFPNKPKCIWTSNIRIASLLLSSQS